MALEDKINTYLNNLKQQALHSEHTLASYTLDLKKFLNFTKHTAEDLNNVNKRICRQYLYYLDQQHYEKTSIIRHISSLRSFWNYLMQKQHVKTNPWTEIALPKCPKKLPKFLSTDQMSTFLNNIDTSTPTGQRNRMICEFLYATGCRVSELVSLNINDLNLTENECRVIGKRNKQRIVIFANITTLYIQNYLKHCRPLWNKTQTNAFLINQKGTRLTSRSIQRIIKSCSEKQHLDNKITPHTLRHSFATDMFNGGADLGTVKELLGHENIATTEIYTHISEKILIKTYNNAHPRGSKKHKK